MNWISLISIPIAYLLGSISSASIVARVFGKIDIRDEQDGKISAAAVYRRVGKSAFFMVVVMDIGKTALAVLAAQWLNADPLVVMLAGVVAIAGHQWSPFLKFQGGLGATAIAGVLVSVVTFPTFIGAAVAIILMLCIKKSSLSFGIGVFSITVFLFLMKLFQFGMPQIMIASPLAPVASNIYYLLAFYPIILALMMVIKAMQVRYRPGVKIK